MKVFSRFKEVVNAVSIREDGKILAAGGDDKKVPPLSVDCCRRENAN